MRAHCISMWKRFIIKVEYFEKCKIYKNQKSKHEPNLNIYIKHLK